ncbi:MAG: heavy metal-binding domain-containing protein [Bacteroidota bacterium]
MKKTLFSLLACTALLASVCLFSSCGGQSAQEPKKELDAKSDTADQLVYICPCGGCPEVKESQPGKCPKCEMDLVEEKK